ncbi:MAG: hypothetical protein HY925_03085 [Elusimicrobia bacterium]|nr:hypothetical protein [Elusimicrobiota bacterium]
MTLDDLKGSYQSPDTGKAGTRYQLELDGANFNLIAAAWAFTGRMIPGTDKPMIELLGKRRLEGNTSLNGGGLTLTALQMTDTPAPGRGVTGAPPIRRAVNETIPVEIPPDPPLRLRFKLYGADVLVARR